jgi:flagellar biosynthesis regulator FlbT
MVRHLFFPLMRLGVSKQMANVFIFTFSAVMHELLISVRHPTPL